MVFNVVDQVLPKKRKRFNKNRKKAWRKKTNISEAEEALDNERREERFGGPLEEKRDSELLFLDLGDGSSGAHSKDEECRLEFFLDKVPGEPGSSGNKKNVGLKPSRKKVQAKTLKSHQFISGLQGAKPPHKPQSKQNAVSVAKKKKALLQMKNSKLIEKFKLSAKQIEDSKIVNGPPVIIRRKFDCDLWTERADDTSKECIKKGLEDSFIKDISNYYRTETKQRSVKVPNCRYVPVSKLNAVEIPKAGTSYNPAYGDHQELMQEAVLQEEKRQKKNERIERATTRFFPTIDKAPSESTWLAEMSEGLPKTADEALEDDKNEMETICSVPEVLDLSERHSFKETICSVPEVLDLGERHSFKETVCSVPEVLDLGERHSFKETVCSVPEVLDLGERHSFKETVCSVPEVLELGERHSFKETVCSVPEVLDLGERHSFKDDKEQMTVTSKAKTEKKTKKQRKKEQKQKIIQVKRLQEKKKRVRDSDVFRIKRYLKEIDESEKLTKKRIDGRIARKEQLKSMPRRLGSLKFEEEDVQVKLGDELPDSLRQITPAMNLIEERFKHLQRRNLIEPRLPHKMKRKYKLKKTVKRSYKMEFEKISQMSDLVSK
ncbi:ribosome biogenesis protein NOP53 isoform X4 [Panulirus ornatus]|uniref:ribosome biogenesis protein NOP53 isoform X2 n=1 Tax=Panulirus ornatus TaxID=150431 RepID=UPI003A88F967